MGFFSSISSLFGGGQPDAAVPAPMPMMMPMQPLELPAAAANEAPPSNQKGLTEQANDVLKATLASLPVQRYNAQGTAVTVPFHVKSIKLEPSGIRAADGAAFVIADSDAGDAIKHGEAMALRITLPHAATDYDKQSYSQAIAELMRRIPGIGHLVEAKPIHADLQPTYGDVWHELQPHLQKLVTEGKLSAHECSMIGEYYTAHQGKPDAAEHWPAIHASHYNERVSIDVSAKKLPGDETAATSPETAINAWIAANHDAILAKVKEKALAQGVLKPGDLDHLAMHMEANGWGISAEFGTSPTATTDQQTGQPLTPKQIAEKMTATLLASIPTERMAKIFEEVLLEPAAGMEMPPFLSRILSGPMVKDILHHRAPNHPEIDALMAKFEMFKSEADLKAKAAQDAKAHRIVLGEPYVTHAADGAPELQLNFELPPEITAHQLMTSIATGKHVIQSGAKAMAAMGHVAAVTEAANAPAPAAGIAA